MYRHAMRGTPYVNKKCSAVDANGTPHHYFMPRSCVMLRNGRGISLVATSSPCTQSLIISADSEMWLVAEDNIVPFMVQVQHQANLSQQWTGVRGSLCKGLQDCKSASTNLPVAVHVRYLKIQIPCTPCRMSTAEDCGTATVSQLSVHSKVQLCAVPL